MRLQAYDDNGTMKFRQVSGSQALDSLPVGTSISYSGSVAPNGYLFCDGSTFDAAKYPELYSKLGTNVLPVMSDPSQPTAKLPIDGTGSVPFSLTTTNTAAPYDGIINFGYNVPHGRAIYINDVVRAISGNGEGGNTTQVQVNKGDLVKIDSGLASGVGYNWAIWYTKPKLIKAATIGIADISINAIKDALNDWVDITSDFTITEFNWSNSTTKILYNAALKKLKVKTTSASAASNTVAHGVKITYNGSDQNISFGDNVIIYGSTNYSANVAVAGYEPQISIINASELQLYGHNRNATSAWPAGTSLVFIVEM